MEKNTNQKDDSSKKKYNSKKNSSYHEKNNDKKKNDSKILDEKTVDLKKNTNEKNTKAKKKGSYNKEDKNKVIDVETVVDSSEEAVEVVEEIDDDMDVIEDDDWEEIDEVDDSEEEPVKIKEVKTKAKKDKAAIKAEKKAEAEKKKEEKRLAQEKIKNIANKEKQMKKKKKKNFSNSKYANILTFLDKNRYSIYAFIAGVLITVFVVILIWPDRIATLKNGEQPVVKVGGKTYTADELYENMKGYYSVSLLLDQIDNDLLTKLYPEDDAMKDKVSENAEYYLNMYKQYYNYTQEEFLEKNGFSSYEAFLDYLRLDYRREQYLDDFVKKSLTDDEIQKFYDEKVYGDINTQHMLVEVKASDEEDSDKLSDEDAKKLAEEIITKLNDGAKWEDVKEEYKDKITFEDLGYQSWDASLEESFMTALKKLEDNSYSTEPVKTSYGYHVIYRLDQKKKPSLKKVKDTIINKLVTDKKSADSNLKNKALISLRRDKKIKFNDTVMESKYDIYCKQYK